jgi:hypothetical protein
MTDLAESLESTWKLRMSGWHVDETFVRIAGKWMYLFQADFPDGFASPPGLPSIQDGRGAAATRLGQIEYGGF